MKSFKKIFTFEHLALYLTKYYEPGILTKLLEKTKFEKNDFLEIEEIKKGYMEVITELEGSVQKLEEENVKIRRDADLASEQAVKQAVEQAVKQAAEQATKAAREATKTVNTRTRSARPSR